LGQSAPPAGPPVPREERPSFHLGDSAGIAVLSPVDAACELSYHSVTDIA